jgi:hypothetical protein
LVTDNAVRAARSAISLASCQSVCAGSDHHGIVLDLRRHGADAPAAPKKTSVRVHRAHYSSSHL